MRFGYVHKHSRFLDIIVDFGQAGKILDRNLGDFGQNFGQVDQMGKLGQILSLLPSSLGSKHIP